MLHVLELIKEFNVKAIAWRVKVIYALWETFYEFKLFTSLLVVIWDNNFCGELPSKLQANKIVLFFFSGFSHASHLR